MAAFRITFTVEGSGNFPLDMLRYDHCYPRHPKDVDNISISVGDLEDYTTPRKVQLATHVNTTKSHAKTLFSEDRIPTVGRWQSFGWKVTEKWLEDGVTL